MLLTVMYFVSREIPTTLDRYLPPSSVLAGMMEMLSKVPT